MSRYLLRIANDNGYSPKDLDRVSKQVRELLGSKESARHFRISTNAVEFNMFAEGRDEHDKQKRSLEQGHFHIITDKLLDTPPSPIGRKEAVREGVRLFNEERFWESHEVLEQTWRTSKGATRETLQSMILTAAAFVHYQKDETDIGLSILKRARSKMKKEPRFESVDLDSLRVEVDEILDSGRIHLFKLFTDNA